MRQTALRTVLGLAASLSLATCELAAAPQQAVSLSSSADHFREYRSSIMRRVYTRVIYPSRAIARNQQGLVVVKLAVDKRGNLLDLDLAQASDYKLLNDAAMRAVKISAPYAKAPLNISSNTLEIKIPINFRIPEH